MYCNNCGLETHTFKNCPDPIISYGIICYYFDEKTIKKRNINNVKKFINDNIKYLMIRRRNSFTYIEFMRAKYKLLEPKYIQTLFNHMTLYEREIITKNKFNFLWNRLWLIKKNEMTNAKNKSDFYKGIIKFNILQQGFINNLDNKVYSTEYFVNNSCKSYRYPEWYFPKGRKNQNESNINCAKREFIEETNIDYNDFKVLYDIKKLEELHVGTNNVTYKTIFYVSKYKYNQNKLPLFTNETKNKYQRQEIGDVKLLTYNEIISKFRDYEQSKVDIITKLHKKMVNNIYSEYQIN
jgi:8-oxo-dGTP pyrophosphatase MutT (NUDIX family)